MSHSQRTAAFIAIVLLVIGAGGAFAQSGTFGDAEPDPPRPVIRTYEVRITANVRGASIYVDGRYQGQAPQTLRLREGTYEIEVEARGYESWGRRVTVRRDQTLNANLIPPTAVVLLRIPPEFLNDTLVDPWRLIDFYVDGRLRPGARVDVEPGWHTVSLVIGGLKLEREFFFEAGRTYTVEVFMRADISTRSEF